MRLDNIMKSLLAGMVSVSIGCGIAQERTIDDSYEQAPTGVDRYDTQANLDVATYEENTETRDRPSDNKTFPEIALPQEPLVDENQYRIPETDCDNGWDDDGDGLIDHDGGVLSSEPTSLDEGMTGTYSLSGNEYTVTVNAVRDGASPRTASVTVNSETLTVEDSFFGVYPLTDGTSFVVWSVADQEDPLSDRVDFALHAEVGGDPDCQYRE